MHVDMDAFFASVEQRDHPELRGKPVVVGALPGGRGVVSTCSYEARVFGLHSAMPISEAYRRCPQAIYLPADLERYADVSEQVMAILDGISPLVEPVSIDEAYVDIAGLDKLFGPPLAIGQRVKQRVRDELGLTLSVGIGPNRLIAKIASDLHKPDGLTVVPPEQVLDFLAPLPVSVLRGVGKKTASLLHEQGIRTVAQLRALDAEEIESRFGESAGGHLYLQARGVASSEIVSGYQRKSISQERTFQVDVTDPGVLRDKLLKLAGGVGRIARSQALRPRVITLKLRLAGFETHHRQATLDRPTQSDDEIFAVAWRLYQESGMTDRPVRLIGVGLSHWADGTGDQLGLFDRAPRRSEQLYRAVDAIKDKFGSKAIGLGAAGQTARAAAGRDDDEPDDEYAAGAPDHIGLVRDRKARR